MGDYTDFLFARPSFLEGMARVYDLGGTLQEYNNAPSAEEADAIALEMDAQAVGQDFWLAMKKVAEEALGKTDKA